MHVVKTTTTLIAGVDEAGRGPLAGPVVAAAVILDPSKPILGLDDSKKLTPSKRERLAGLIKESALAVSISEVGFEEIDRINILQASLLAMKQAVESLELAPEHVLVDGNKTPDLNYSCEAIVGGDKLVPAISAASILAKIHRDRILIQYDKIYPGYGFARHKGYPTKAHYEALRRLGPSHVHRRSFRLA